jgi:DNA-binding winged helix-turn-helix (wHTH) protein/Tfp pilus assembly protein PilF
MDTPETEIYEFGSFQVDAGRHLLLGVDGGPVSLAPKAFETLLYLVRHSQIVIEKEALMEAIWPDTIVEENNLNQNISALRRALGGKRADHRYIVTVPGRGYRFVAPVRKHIPPAAAIFADSIRSVAVLPFQPLVSGDRDASLEMGMADTLIARLSSIRHIIVRPLSSVRKYADLHQDALLAGRELGVESVLQGSLQHRADKIRVTVRLLRVSNGASLLAGTFDEEMRDIFALQDAIAQRVVEALAFELSSEDKARLIKRHTENTKAYQLYLKGRYYWWKNSPQEYKKSLDYFHRAVEEDPSYALGYCGLNSYYGYGAAWGMLPPEDGWPKAEWAVTKALELDDQLPEAHLDLAALRMVYYLDWVGTEREARRAMELSPGFDEIHYAYSFFLLVMRRFREAVAEAKRALACNPLSLRISQHLGYALYCARSYDEAIQQYRKALELDPNDASVCEALGDTHERNGEYRKAVEEWTKAMLQANDTELVASLGAANTKEAVDRAVRGVAAKRLDRLLRNRERGDYIPAIRFAREHLRAGYQEEALKWLTLACEERNVYSLMIGCDPLYDPLRTDKRFIKLLQRMKLDGQSPPIHFPAVMGHADR